MDQISRPEQHATGGQPETEGKHAADEQPGTPTASTKTSQSDNAPSAPVRDAHRVRVARLLGMIVVGVLVVMVGLGIWNHASTSNAAKTATAARADAVPRVHTIQVKAETKPQLVDLPGTMQAFEAATLYARATGYIATRNVDIGSKMKKGDVLAIIAAPDLDQQLVQARAQLIQMQASFRQALGQRGLANATNQRTSRLVSEGWDSRQQGDQDRTTLNTQSGAVSVAQANIAAQAAQVNRLAELVGFEQVTAPFDGVITARQIDVGNLVTADASSGTSLFSIAKTDTLRVQVYVPQSHIFSLQDGQSATITVPQLPGRIFHGRVARNAAALSANTRTLLAEVDVDNRDGALSAGLYGIVHIQVPPPTPIIIVPTQAIIFDDHGLSVAIVDGDKLTLRHLDVASDDGSQVRVQGGLKDGDRVILYPPVDLVAGMKVKTF